MLIEGHSTTVRNCEFLNNDAPDGGAAIRIDAGLVKVEGSVFRDNSAPVGGAIDISENSFLHSIKNGLFVNSLLQNIY